MSNKELDIGDLVVTIKSKKYLYGVGFIGKVVETAAFPFTNRGVDFNFKGNSFVHQDGIWSLNKERMLHIRDYCEQFKDDDFGYLCTIRDSLYGKKE